MRGRSVLLVSAEGKVASYRRQRRRAGDDGAFARLHQLKPIGCGWMWATGTIKSLA